MTYTFTVKANSASGDSPASEASNPVIPGSTPNAPTNVIAIAGDGKATVTFSMPVSNGGPIFGYTVTASPGGLKASNDSNVITLTGLSQACTYTFTVTAINVIGTSSASAPSNPVTIFAAGYTYTYPSDPTEWRDADDYTTPDHLDNCPSIPNQNQSDTDSDRLGDVCDDTPNTAHYGSVIDAPHNKYHGVSCTDCHYYDMWWLYSPAKTNTLPNFGTITNAVCTKCHSNTITHSGTGSTGASNMNCVDCHSAHDQSQVDWRTTDANELYLAKGTISGNFVRNPRSTGRTTFNYTNLVCKIRMEQRVDLGQQEQQPALQWPHPCGGYHQCHKHLQGDQCHQLDDHRQGWHRPNCIK